MTKEVEGLKHHTHFFPDLVNVGLGIQNVDAVYEDVAFVSLLQHVQAAQYGAFS